MRFRTGMTREEMDAEEDRLGKIRDIHQELSFLVNYPPFSINPKEQSNFVEDFTLGIDEDDDDPFAEVMQKWLTRSQRLACIRSDTPAIQRLLHRLLPKSKAASRYGDRYRLGGIQGSRPTSRPRNGLFWRAPTPRREVDAVRNHEGIRRTCQKRQEKHCSGS